MTQYGNFSSCLNDWGKSKGSYGFKTRVPPISRSYYRHSKGGGLVSYYRPLSTLLPDIAGETEEGLQLGHITRTGKMSRHFQLCNQK